MTVASTALTEQRVVGTGTRADRAWEKHQISYCPTTDQVWLLNSNASSISVLDGTTADAVGTIQLPASPQQVVFDTTAGVGYAVLLGDAVAIMEVRTGQVQAIVALPEGSHP